MKDANAGFAANSAAGHAMPAPRIDRSRRAIAGIDRAKRYARHAIEDANAAVVDRARDLRKAAKRAQYAAEDLRDETRQQIRRRPLASVGWAFLSGAAVVTTVVLVARIGKSGTHTRDRSRDPRGSHAEFDGDEFQTADARRR